MKKIVSLLIMVVAMATAMNATVLFPMFVDIAPGYGDGVTEEFKAAGVDSAMYHLTSHSFYPKTFTELESYFKDAMPSDVNREERMIGDKRLVIYSSVQRSSDPIPSAPLYTAIYVLEQPDNSFTAVYQEYNLEE